MLTQLRTLIDALLSRSDSAAIEAAVQDYHDAMAGLEGRIIALEAKLGVAPTSSTPTP